MSHPHTNKLFKNEYAYHIPKPTNLVQVHIILAVAEIQELGQVGSYMLDIMDIITSGKEFLFNILIS